MKKKFIITGRDLDETFREEVEAESPEAIAETMLHSRRRRIAGPADFVVVRDHLSPLKVLKAILPSPRRNTG